MSDSSMRGTQAREANWRLPSFVATAGLICSATGPALAEADPWRLRIGLGRIAFHEKITLSTGGSELPGAGARVSDNSSLLAEIGYRFATHWSTGLTIGIPPTTTVRGSGAAEALGEFGRIRYGPAALTCQYQFGTGATVSPYLGAGLAYYLVLRDRDGSIDRLKVDNAWGTVLQAGVDYALSPSLGLFLDVKKLFLKTTATGTLPAARGAAVRAEARLDPLVINAGLVLRF
jgi:outer membrane protein